MTAIAHERRLAAVPTPKAAPRVPLAVLVAAALAVATCLALVLALMVGQRTGADGPLLELAQVVVVRYGASWIALAGVVLLGLALLRPERGVDDRVPTTAEAPRPQLRLIVCEGPR